MGVRCSSACSICPQCGKQRPVLLSTTGKCRSCSLIVHGESQTRLYRIWMAMRIRCGVTPKPHPKHADYKDKGITVCPEWAHDFHAFKVWAVANGYADGLTIDRRKNELGYSPDNCRWVTQLENNRNRTTVRLTHSDAAAIKAATESGAALARRYGVSPQTICDIRKGRIWADV